MNDNLSQASVPRRLRLPSLERASALYLFAFVILLFSLWIPDTFLTSITFRLVAADQVVIAILALAILVPLVGGAFDLSVGAMLAFSLVVLTWLESNTELNAALSSVIAIGACCLVGFVSGLLVVRLKVNSFIATLGMSQILGATSLLISENRQIAGVFSEQFLSYGRRDLVGVPIVFVYLIGLALVVWYVLQATPLGRNLFATGSNPEAARLSGVKTDSLVWGSLVVSAAIAGLGGVVYGMKIGSYSNSFGPPLLFPAFAAVFFGATQFTRRPNVWGTLVAVYVLAFGVKGLQLAFTSGVYWITPMFNGVALLAAVTLASRTGLLRLRRTRRRTADATPADVDDASQDRHDVPSGHVAASPDEVLR